MKIPKPLSVVYSKAFYLLYNGQPFFRGKFVKFTSPFKQDCLGELSLDFLGLGLLHREFIEEQMAKNSSFSFQDAYSDMNSLRLIFCCVDKFNSLHEYSEEDIKGFRKSLKRFKEIRNEDNIEENKEEENFHNQHGLANTVVFCE